MDSSNYKDLSTTRGVVYHYYISAPKGKKPTLLFLHGFPSTSYDWRHQIAFFRQEGYGLIVPDMLGYGGTSKPTNFESYKMSLVTKDIVEILDAEKIETPIVIGHDWGSKVTSRLANYYPERFTAFAFLALGYLPPSPDYISYEDNNAMSKKLAGYELFGYQAFFSEEGADKLIEAHLDSFQSIVYPRDPTLWIHHFAPTGVLKAWVEADRKTERAAYVSEEDLLIHKSELRKGGLAAPLCWYKTITAGRTEFEDDLGIPKENILIQKPVFFGASLKDFVCLAEAQKVTTASLAKDLTVHEYDACHWVQLEAKDELNRDLLAWIKAL